MRYPVVLASASPRRVELLRELVPEFEVVPAEIVEEDHVHDDPWVTAQRTAREKAIAVAEVRPDCLIIGGDTVVALPSEAGWTQLAKPKDVADAVWMLGVLSGKTHTVVTGVCLIWPNGFSAFTEATKVTFKAMTEHEIRDYVATGEPMDKAGAYGFQGGARPFVERVEGSVSNVVGLPLERLKEALASVS
ncbi:MAG: septum formation protein Maf [Armatimonadetes bacterium]|nr:septum formation protein Maf [Armatimonadota bacterium]